MNLFPFFLISNSLLTLGFILNQNDTMKDATNTPSSNVSPFEKLTWIGIFFQFLFLLVQLKMTDL